jgi:hypothetical protein
MTSKKYSIQDTLAKNGKRTANQPGFAIKRVCKNTLFTSSSLHQHKRKKPS